MTTIELQTASAVHSEPVVPERTIWGLDLMQLHDYYWAARGVQVVRLGEPSTVVDRAELFLLSDDSTLVLFRMRSLLDTLSWTDPTLLFTRVHDTRNRPYQEHAITRPDGVLERFIRLYSAKVTFSARVAFTSDPDIARAWQTMSDTARPWRTMRKKIPATRRESMSVPGRIYDRYSPSERNRFLNDLVRLWSHPSAIINRATRRTSGIWIDPTSRVDSGARFVGEVWVGAGRHLPGSELVVGPAIVWDDPEHRPSVESIQWSDIEPAKIFTRPQQLPQRSSASRVLKRWFDIAFALFAILLTLPLYPFVMLAIFLEDGWPFIFTHSRETMRGVEFPCLKFRSMRKDAETIKASLSQKNQADGPQFFIENDPRLTRIGRIIRKTNIDELPQFFNVLVGHMSIVGPRPSPVSENQFCPAWREARLSVRPGITGLWQVSRTRIRGSDFQEWIKYDIEYVERQSWRLDLAIIWKTIIVILRGVITP